MKTTAPTSPRYLEDLELGERYVSEPVTLTQQDIVDFARAYDPQAMHVDPEQAASGPFKGLIASGWHVAALAMRLSVESHMFGGTPIIGAGVDELRWLQPVRPGDTLTLERTLIGIEPPKHQKGRGTIKSLMVMRNQAGDVVLQMTAIAKVPVRPS